MSERNITDRPPPKRPFALGAALLQVPAAAFEATFQLLQAAGSNEACVFWYGERAGRDGRVTVVRAPAQQTTRFNYHVDERARSAMADTIAATLRPLAQIHSHPGISVEHSGYDDVMVASRRTLSLVFPLYGRRISLADWHEHIGVHEWQDDYWHLLPPLVARRRVAIVAGEVDVRDLR